MLLVSLYPRRSLKGGWRALHRIWRSRRGRKHQRFWMMTQMVRGSSIPFHSCRLSQAALVMYQVMSLRVTPVFATFRSRFSKIPPRAQKSFGICKIASVRRKKKAAATFPTHNPSALRRGRDVYVLFPWTNSTDTTSNRSPFNESKIYPCTFISKYIPARIFCCT